MNANLTFFQQIIAGDSWGLVTITIIEKKPWTAVFFIVVFVTISLAIMNVILAIIVECAQETRQGDLQQRLRIREEIFVSKSRQLLKVCGELDFDNSGDLSLHELLDGFETNKDFRDVMKDMGIEK